MDENATHIYALALAIRTFGVRVLEIGCGWYSTSLIHALCKGNALTIEENESWFNALKPIANNSIRLYTDIVYGALMQVTSDWDIVFIDSYRGEDRVVCADIFLNRTCIVAHDTEQSYWNPILDKAKYQKHFNFIGPRTSWLSNSIKL